MFELDRRARNKKKMKKNNRASLSSFRRLFHTNLPSTSSRTFTARISHVPRRDCASLCQPHEHDDTRWLGGHGGGRSPFFGPGKRALSPPWPPPPPFFDLDHLKLPLSLSLSLSIHKNSPSTSSSAPSPARRAKKSPNRFRKKNERQDECL